MQNNNIKNKGIFISIEGVDGSGKSTQIKLLKRYFKKIQYNDIVFTREPGGAKLSEKLRKIVLDKKNNSMTIETELLLLLAARNEHCAKIIKPALNNGINVICDRFIDSTYAYQCNKSTKYNLLYKKLNALILSNFKPDITILLDLNPKISLNRITKRKFNNDYDNMDLKFFNNVFKTYKKLAENNKRIKSIDAKLSAEKVFERVKIEILKKMDVSKKSNRKY